MIYHCKLLLGGKYHTMHKKRNHLYFLIGTTLAMLLFVQVFIDNTLTDFNTSRVAKSNNQEQNEKMQQGAQNQYNSVQKIVLDKDKI